MSEAARTAGGTVVVEAVPIPGVILGRVLDPNGVLVGLLQTEEAG